ncbi:diguanylate cyclase, partial [bacterium]
MRSRHTSILIAALAVMHTAGALAAGDPPHPAAAIVERSVEEVRRDPELSRHEADRAMEALSRQPDADLELRTRLVLCDYYAERNLAAAEAQRDAAANLLPSVRRQGFRAGQQTCAGQVAEARGDNSLAYRSYEEATRLAENAKDDEMLADALFARGYLLGVRGDYAGGLRDLRRAQLLFEHLGKALHALTALNSIAIIYNRMGDAAQAQQIYQRALQAQRTAGLRREEAVTQYNLARAAFQAALQLSRELAYDRAQAYALRGLAAVALAENDPVTALRFVGESLPARARIVDARLSAQFALVEGGALRRLRRLTEARAKFETARLAMEQGDGQVELVELYDELAALEVAGGDWRAAYQWRTRSRDLGERLLRNQIDQRFATQRVEFDTATKEKENAALVKANEANELALSQTERARALQVVAIALALALAAVLAGLALHQRRSNLRMRALAMTDELTEAPNRRAVLGRLQRLLEDERERAVCVLLLDIDHFKVINDRFGHAVGDRVLQSVAARLRACMQSGDFHGRIGGE